MKISAVFIFSTKGLSARRDVGGSRLHMFNSMISCICVQRMDVDGLISSWTSAKLGDTLSFFYLSSPDTRFSSTNFLNLMCAYVESSIPALERPVKT